MTWEDSSRNELLVVEDVVDFVFAKDDDDECQQSSVDETTPGS
jgi:hypothetical protein